MVERDGLQCTFVDDQGRRCQETGFLETQHTEPSGRLGCSGLDNVQVYCHAHNQYAARKDYGAAYVERRIREERQKRQKKK